MVKQNGEIRRKKNVNEKRQKKINNRNEMQK